MIFEFFLLFHVSNSTRSCWKSGQRSLYVTYSRRTRLWHTVVRNCPVRAHVAACCTMLHRVAWDLWSPQVEFECLSFFVIELIGGSILFVKEILQNNLEYAGNGNETWHWGSFGIVPIKWISEYANIETWHTANSPGVMFHGRFQLIQDDFEWFLLRIW